MSHPNSASPGASLPPGAPDGPGAPRDRLLAGTALVMVRPFRAYAALAREPDHSFWTGAARLLFVLGAFVALTSTGRLAPAELLGAFGSFAYAPVIQAVALGVALRAVRAEVRFSRAFALYLEGHGPYFVLFVVVSAMCLLAPEPGRVVLGAALPLVVVTLAWGGLLTYALFRSGLSLGRGRAAFATATFYTAAVGAVLGYFLAAGQLAPILPFVWR